MNLEEIQQQPTQGWGRYWRWNWHQTSSQSLVSNGDPSCPSPCDGGTPVYQCWESNVIHRLTSLHPPCSHHIHERHTHVMGAEVKYQAVHHAYTEHLPWPGNLVSPVTNKTVVPCRRICRPQCSHTSLPRCKLGNIRTGLQAPRWSPSTHSSILGIFSMHCCVQFILCTFSIYLTSIEFDLSLTGQQSAFYFPLRYVNILQRLGKELQCTRGLRAKITLCSIKCVRCICWVWNQGTGWCQTARWGNSLMSGTCTWLLLHCSHANNTPIIDEKILNQCDVTFLQRLALLPRCQTLRKVQGLF